MGSHSYLMLSIIICYCMFVCLCPGQAAVWRDQNSLPGSSQGHRGSQSIKGFLSADTNPAATQRAGDQRHHCCQGLQVCVCFVCTRVFVCVSTCVKDFVTTLCLRIKELEDKLKWMETKLKKEEDNHIKKWVITSSQTSQSGSEGNLLV